MIRVKICGMTTEGDALKAASMGAWAVGFVFYKKSERHVGAYKVKKIIASLPPFVTPVAVFADLKEGAARDILRFCGIRTVQFHGDETPEYCRHFREYTVIKAFRVTDDFDVQRVKDYDVNAYLFDAYQPGLQGGTGKTFNWALIKAAKNFGKPIILSGGLTPGNVQTAIEEVKPYAVDVSSGVEDAPGKKSERLMREFLNRVYL